MFNVFNVFNVYISYVCSESDMNQQYRPFPATVFHGQKPQNEGNRTHFSSPEEMGHLFATFRDMIYNRQVFEYNISHPFEAGKLFRW